MSYTSPDTLPNPPFRTEPAVEAVEAVPVANATVTDQTAANSKPRFLTPSELRRRRPTFIDVTVPNLGNIRMNRLAYSDAMEMLTVVQNMRTPEPDDPDGATVDVDEIKLVLCAFLGASLGGEWNTDMGVETLQGLTPDEVFTLSRIMNAISGVGLPIPTDADPWQWAVDAGRKMVVGGSSPEREAIETAKNE